jgi:uncharacterized membrane protein required for colicin V production
LDIIGAITSAPLADLGILFFLALFLIAGVMQGPIRRLLGMAVMVVAFLVAANVRDSAGDFLNDNWRQFDLGYNRLLAFALIFGAISIFGVVAVELSYSRVELLARHPVVDDVAGGVVGVLEGLLLLVLLVMILGSFSLPLERPGDVTQVRSAQDLLLHQSHIGGWIRDSVAPIFVHVLSLLLPSDLVSVFP